MKPAMASATPNYKKLLGNLAALITVSAWGSSFLATKVLLEQGHFTPVETFVYRFALAYILMLALSFRQIRSNSWKDELQLALCGICSITIFFILENYALLRTTAGNVSLLSGISPIMTAVLMALVYHTRISKGVVIGSVVAIAGVVCVIFAPTITLGLGFEINPVGDLMALGSAFTWAIYSVMIKRLTPLYSTFFITRKMFFYGVITAIPLILIDPAPTHLSLLFDLAQPKYLLNMLFLVVVCSMMGYVLWNESMKIIGPVTANNYIYLQPLVTMVLAWFLFGEAIYPLGYVGCLLVIGGLVIADKLKS